jgi:hypothetical protein
MAVSSGCRNGLVGAFTTVYLEKFCIGDGFTFFPAGDPFS